MRSTISYGLFAALAALVKAAPTVYLAGDSTMVATGNGDGTVGAFDPVF